MIIKKKKRKDPQRLKHKVRFNIEFNYKTKDSHKSKPLIVYVQAGSVSLPIENIESVALVFSNKTVKPTKISKLFRTSSIPIIGYIKGNKFHIDLKAIPDNQISLLINTVKNCL